MTKSAQFVVHTPNLLKELMNNPGTGVLNVPVSVFARLLAAVATRASELNDPELNALMCRLTLYDIADPESGDYDREAVQAVYKLAK